MSDESFFSEVQKATDETIQESNILLQSIDFPQTKLEEMLDNISPDLMVEKISSFLSNSDNFVNKEGDTSVISQKVGEVLDSLSSIRYSAKLIEDTLTNLSKDELPSSKDDFSSLLLNDIESLLSQNETNSQEDGIIRSLASPTGPVVTQNGGKFKKKTIKKKF